MTDFNKYNPYPYVATIRCPRCENAAEFRKAFALINAGSWQWWEQRLWSCARATDWEAREYWAPGDPQPAWRGWIVLQHDPELYRWKQPAQGHSATDEGIVACLRCVGRQKHVLSWPADAYYRFELPQGLLWAWNRDGVAALIDFIDSKDRDPAKHGASQVLYLRHIPKAFLGAKDRDAIVKRLRRDFTELPE